MLVVRNKKESVEIMKKLNLNYFPLEVFDKNQHKEVSLEEFRASEGKNPPRLYGSGMLVLNAPWKLEEECSEVIDYLRNAF